MSTKMKQFAALALGTVLVLFIIWMLHSVGIMSSIVAGILAVAIIGIDVVLLIIWLLHPSKSSSATANDIFEELVDDYKKDMKDTLKEVIKNEMNK